MFRICKEFHFCASHSLDTLPAGHKCAGLPGHNYIVSLALERETLDETGFIIDFHELDAFKAYIDQEFDHKHLNTVMDLPPTTENLAYHFYAWCKARWPQTSAVRVSETPKTWAEYRPRVAS